MKQYNLRTEKNVHKVRKAGYMLFPRTRNNYFYYKHLCRILRVFG